MIKKYSFSKIIKSYAVVKNIKENKILPYFTQNGLSFTYTMDNSTRVYGLGEATRGINKRGGIFRSYCYDEPFHTEDKKSLYGAHNFLIIDSKDSKERFGVFFDTPSGVTFDIGFSDSSTIKIELDYDGFDIYIINADKLLDIVKEFRELIGKSYVPPYWAFGFGQSRWGYFNKDSIEKVLSSHEKAEIPLDMIYLDIDYMDSFKDFTIDNTRFPDFSNFVSYMKDKGIHLIPIIDAAVKVENEYQVYEEGKKDGYFCKDENGDDYIVGVWPGKSVLPDFLNEKAAKFFGNKYKILTDMGIDGFWNDMNEPAIFYSDKGLKKAFKDIKAFENKTIDTTSFFDLRDTFARISNAQDDYNSFYHNIDGKKIVHNRVHNLYGCAMTISAAEALEKLRPKNRTLLFSRASCIGMHRYSGLWTGDNHSWWSHILLSIQQMPALNMCGFLYAGSDIGGFNADCSRDLLLRWLSFAIFTPLMRNHSAYGTRNQECYAFGETKDFKNIIDLRYRLIPYLYSEFMKAVLNNDMLFKPLCFEYENDETAKQVEDQLLVGDSIMIAPIYKQNANGRYIYLPENMLMMTVKNGEIFEQSMEKGHHYINIQLNEVVFFVRNNKMLPLFNPAKNTKSIDKNHFTLYGNADTYEMYVDNGETKEISSQNIIILKTNK